LIVIFERASYDQHFSSDLEVRKSNVASLLDSQEMGAGLPKVWRSGFVENYFCMGENSTEAMVFFCQ